MRNIIVILLVFLALQLSAQNYDLIVALKGDSLACHIDSIDDTKIYFEMKYNDNWIHTDMNLTEVSEYKHDEIDVYQVIFKRGTSYIKKMRKAIDNSDASLYGSRYLFAPSAYGIKAGAKSYTNYNIFIEDFQFGITDNFSIGAGTSFVFNPIYILPHYTFRINEKSAVAIGDLFLCTTYGGFEFGNLLYGIYTYGNLDNNITIGVGLWASKMGKDKVERIDPGMAPSFDEYRISIYTISPAFNISAQLKLSQRTYFITENYWFKINMDAVAQLRDPVSDATLRAEHYSIEESILAGISGFRIKNKRKPSRSWQVSLVYILAHNGSIPDEYKQGDWETYNNEDGYFFLPIPLISYTWRF